LATDRNFVRAFFDTGKPVGVICPAPWILIESGDHLFERSAASQNGRPGSETPRSAV
jgi:putative intracellular protease/amidase